MYDLPKIICPVNLLLHRFLVIEAHPLIFVVGPLIMLSTIPGTFSFRVFVRESEIVDGGLLIVNDLGILICYDVLDFWPVTMLVDGGLAMVNDLPKYPNVPAEFVQGPGAAASLKLHPVFEHSAFSS